MNTRDIIEKVNNATLNWLKREFCGNDEDFYCEIEKISIEYFEGDYDNESCNIRIRCGRYEDNSKNNFDLTFTLANIEEKFNYDYICGMIDVILSSKNGYYDIDK